MTKLQYPEEVPAGFTDKLDLLVEQWTEHAKWLAEAAKPKPSEHSTRYPDLLVERRVLMRCAEELKKILEENK